MKNNLKKRLRLEFLKIFSILPDKARVVPCFALNFIRLILGLRFFGKQCKRLEPGSNFFGNTPLVFRYSGVNVTNAANFLAKRR